MPHLRTPVFREGSPGSLRPQECKAGWLLQPGPASVHLSTQWSPGPSSQHGWEGALRAQAGPPRGHGSAPLGQPLARMAAGMARRAHGEAVNSLVCCLSAETLRQACGQGRISLPAPVLWHRCPGSEWQPQERSADLGLISSSPQAGCVIMEELLSLSGLPFSHL